MAPPHAAPLSPFQAGREKEVGLKKTCSLSMPRPHSHTFKKLSKKPSLTTLFTSIREVRTCNLFFFISAGHCAPSNKIRIFIAKKELE